MQNAHRVEVKGGWTVCSFFFRPCFVCLSLHVLVGIQNQVVGARGSYQIHVFHGVDLVMPSSPA